MVSTPRKRHASRSPEDNRVVKRLLTSESPEEGELDDPVPPTIQPISLPPKPPPPFKKVPFPFKKKIENHSVGEKPEMLINVFERFEEESARKVREEPRRHRNPRGRRTQKQEVQAYGRKFVGCGLQSDYDVTTKVGEGTFGFVVSFFRNILETLTSCPSSEVHKAIQKSTGKVVALKRILMHNEKEGMPVTALREIKILKALNHVSIVNILDMFVVRSEFETLSRFGDLLLIFQPGTDKDPLSVYMVFPYMDHDLAGLLENERVKLQPSHIKLYMKQLLEGTEYMHRVCHNPLQFRFLV